jgi:hypothetical protein
LRRSNPESFRRGILDCFAALAMTVWMQYLLSNQLLSSGTHICILATHRARALLSVTAPESAEGAGKAGCRLAPAVHCAKFALQKAAQRHTGEAKHPAFPAQWVDGLCRTLPGERCTIAPVVLRMADARARSGRRVTATLDASLRAPGPHDFAVRRLHRSYARRPPLTVSRPAMPFAPTQPASTTSHPACRDDRDTPLGRGGMVVYMIIRNTDKENCFLRAWLTSCWVFCPPCPARACGARARLAPQPCHERVSPWPQNALR